MPMILYYSPGACSLADRIALHEAGLAFDAVKVDLKSKVTEDERDYWLINPKGYVPALALDDGQVLTENIAVLSWVADQAPSLAPTGALARYRLLELLAFVSTELHKAFKPWFNPAAGEAERSAAGQMIGRRLRFVADHLNDDYLFGDRFTVADAYLYVMLTWARRFDLTLPDPLPAYLARIETRAAVRRSLEEEGLAGPKA